MLSFVGALALVCLASSADAVSINANPIRQPGKLDPNKYPVIGNTGNSSTVNKSGSASLPKENATQPTSLPKGTRQTKSICKAQRSEVEKEIKAVNEKLDTKYNEYQSISKDAKKSKNE